MKRRLLMYGAPVVLTAALLVYGIVGRERALSALARVAQEQAIVPVQIISPQPGPTTRPLVLPGTVRAWYEAPIFAQVSGYVHNWNEDYGASVKAGQLLATIDAPSLDAQYAAGKSESQEWHKRTIDLRSPPRRAGKPWRERRPSQGRR